MDFGPTDAALFAGFVLTMGFGYRLFTKKPHANTTSAKCVF
jgi:hypothetical protein